MKKTFLLSTFAILLLVVFISSKIDNNNESFVFTFLNENPNLPETPYAYSDISFPSHFTSDTVESGYDGEVDTTILDLIDNDISTLGRVLFYDEKLSALENMSCASCHAQEFSFTDNKQFSEGISSLTTRNSMQLNDLGWSNNFGFFWDMEFNNLEDMIDIPFKDENEIGAEFNEVSIKMMATEYYPELFENAFGDSEITEERIVDALANFIKSMVTFESRFDQEASNNFEGFTGEELHGKEIFSFACAVCHFEGSINGIGSSNDIVFEFPFIFNNGLESDFTDPGVGDWATGLDGLYKLPTMRNIELTGPYMHDGRFETLDDVIDFYSEDVVSNEWNFLIPEGGFNFTDEQKSDLKAFLLTLTDESFINDVKWSDPFSPINSVIQEEEIELSVAPNPMTDFATISIENKTGKAATITVFDQMGRNLLTDSFFGESYNFNKNTLASGIYNVNVKTDKGTRTIQLIVQ